jgi:hypothetical protein
MKAIVLASAFLVAASGTLFAQTFKGYPCTVDCSGHEAGYEWAERKGINDISDCGGNSNSFIEGCQSFVEENEPEDYGSFESGGSDDFEEGEEE